MAVTQFIGFAKPHAPNRPYAWVPFVSLARCPGIVCREEAELGKRPPPGKIGARPKQAKPQTMVNFYNDYELVMSSWEEAGRWHGWAELKPKTFGLDGVEVAGGDTHPALIQSHPRRPLPYVSPKSGSIRIMSDPQRRKALEIRMDERARKYAEHVNLADKLC